MSTLWVDPNQAKTFECAVCQSIYEKPVQVGCNEHVFCMKCVDGLVSSGQSREYFNCPLCRRQCEVKDNTRVKFIDRQINQLKLKCKNAIHYKIDKDEARSKRRRLNEDAGCQWIGCYSDLDEHLKECSYEPELCIFCRISVARNRLEDHHKMCVSYPLKCNECGKEKILRADMDRHIKAECPKTVVGCQLCKRRNVTRGFLRCHNEYLCPEATIECQFKKYGCEIEYKRKDEKMHYTRYSVSHMRYLMYRQEESEEKIENLTQENKRLSKKVERMQKAIAGAKDDVDNLDENDDKSSSSESSEGE